MALIDASDVLVNFYRLEGNKAIGNVSIYRGMIRFESIVYFNIDSYQPSFTSQAEFEMLPENYQKMIRGSIIERIKLFLNDNGIKTPFD